MINQSHEQRPWERKVDPLTAVGALLALIAATALVTYGLLIIPGKLMAAEGPPEEFRVAATQQALGSPATPTAAGADESADSVFPPGSEGDQNTQSAPAQSNGSSASGEQASPTLVPTENPFGTWPIPENMDADYWLSIPAIGVEAPIIAFTPWDREVDGVTVLRLPVPNFYGVSWDARSAEPGVGGNTVLAGHSNLYGGVFGDIDELTYGQEIAIWSPNGVFSYYISQIEYIEENNQPLEVRYQNAQWMQQTSDSRVTLITCWPRSNSTHRLIVVATR